jgi:flagellar M-ring protein FliF
MSFATDANASDVPTAGWPDRVKKTVSDYSSLLRPGSLLILFILAYLFVLRPIQKEALRPGQPLIAQQPGLVLPLKSDGFALAPVEVADSAKRAGLLKEEAIELVKHKPTDTTRAVQAWLREEAL